jgi:UDP:flavonoid glycosyltransferase YjiC (YdhE family)
VAGVEHIPFVDYRSFLELHWSGAVPVPGWVPSFARGFASVRGAMVQSAVGLARELEPIIRHERVECLLSDFFSLGARYAAERTGCAFATLAASGMAALDASGVPVAPPNPRMRRLPPWLLHRLVDRAFPLKRARAELGLPPRQESLPEFFSLMASEALHLVPSPREFLPVEKLREGQACVGPLTFDLPRPEGSTFRVDDLKPGTVLISTTTTGKDGGLFGRVLQATAPLGVPILATAASAAEVPTGLGEHVRIEPFVPHEEVFPHIGALVTHGGWGTLGRALRHGVPMLIISIFGDQPMAGARLAEMGLGHHLRLAQATPEAIRSGVERLLADKPLKQRIQAMAERLRGLDPSTRSAELLEALVARR